MTKRSKDVEEGCLLASPVFATFEAKEKKCRLLGIIKKEM